MLMFAIPIVLGQGFPGQSKEAKAESARYAFNRATWGYLTTLDGSKMPKAEVASFSDGTAANSTGRLWFYMMDEAVEADDSYAAAITVSEASYNATCGFAGTVLDPEDPRCAKITIAGTMTKSSGDDVTTGKAALFSKHPQMKTWPAGHGFTVFELVPSDIWMSALLAQCPPCPQFSISPYTVGTQHKIHLGFGSPPCVS